MDKKNIAILISGNGGLMRRAIINETREDCNYFIKAVIASNKNCQGLNIAKMLKKKTYCVEFGIEKDWIENSKEIFSLISAIDKIDYIIMLGFTKKITIFSEWDGRIYNIHPSLLPKFGGKGMIGKKVHEAVIKSGIEESGFTVHAVDNEYDKGKIISQYKIKVGADDDSQTLQKKIIELQHEKLHEVFTNICISQKG